MSHDEIVVDRRERKGARERGKRMSRNRAKHHAHSAFQSRMMMLFEGRRPEINTFHPDSQRKEEKKCHCCLYKMSCFFSLHRLRKKVSDSSIDSTRKRTMQKIGQFSRVKLIGLVSYSNCQTHTCDAFRFGLIQTDREAFSIEIF